MLESTVTPDVRHDADRIVPWGLSQAVGGFALSFFVYLAAGATFLAVFHRFYTQHQLSAEIVAYQFLGLGVAISVVVLVFLRFGVGPAALGFRRPNARALALTVVAIVPILVGVEVFTTVLNALFHNYVQGNAKQTLPVSHKNATLAKEAAAILWAGIEVPLIEETLFRGLVFQGMRAFFERWFPTHVAIFSGALVSGLAFGLAHGEPHTFPILALLGLLLAYVFHYGRSVYCSVLMHGIINTLAVVQVFNSA